MTTQTRANRPSATAGRIRLRPMTTRRALTYLRGQTPQVAALAAVITIDSLLVVVPPLLFQRIIDDGVIPGNLQMVGWLCVAAFSALVLTMGTRIGVHWLGARLGGQIMHRVRSDAFAHTQRLPIAFYTGQRSGALISRMTSDTALVQSAVSNVMPQLVSNLIRLVFVVVAIAVLSWQVLLMLALVPLIIVLPVRWFGRVLHQISHDSMRSQAHLTTYVTERLNVAGAMLAKLYGKPGRDQSAFDTLSGRNRDIHIRMSAIGAVFSAGMGWLTSTAVVALYLLGGYLAISGAITVGTLVALAALVPQLFGPVRSLSETHVHVMKMVASFERIFELLDREPTSDRVAIDGKASSGDDGTLEFSGVYFTYRPQQGLDEEDSGLDDRRPVPVLRDVSFRVERGQRVGVVGPSGAGKSTIAALVPRLHDVDAGTVRVNGHDVRDLPLASLRDTVGVLTQDAYLYHDTIRANLLYAAPDADEADLIAACEAARIWPLINSLPEGLDTVVGDRGYRLSGGEKQRLAIARLLLKDPSVVVLDEATAHLDNDSERAVQEALDRCLVGRTTLVIAHRLSTVRNADQILVVDQGRVVERGTHDELVGLGGLYATLYQDEHTPSDSPTPVAVPAGTAA